MLCVQRTHFLKNRLFPEFDILKLEHIQVCSQNTWSSVHKRNSCFQAPVKHFCNKYMYRCWYDMGCMIQMFYVFWRSPLMIGFLFFSVLRHHESAIHRLGGFYDVHDPLNFYHRPYHDHNGVTCVHLNVRVRLQLGFCSGYSFFFLNHLVYRQEMNFMNIFTIIISTNLKVTIIILILYFKRMYV